MIGDGGLMLQQAIDEVRSLTLFGFWDDTREQSFD